LAKPKGLVIAGCVLLCTLSLLGGRSNAPAAPGTDSGPHPARPDGVLVEAFVVEVDLPALARLQVSPIGEEPHVVTVADILKCLNANAARVVGGGKVVSQRGAKTSVQTTKAPFLKDSHTGQSARQDTYESGARFSVEVNSVSETAVSVQFNIVYGRFTGSRQPPDTPAGTEDLEWSSAATLILGRPQIVAATQDSQTAVFLLLTAHAQGE